jgi:hypothetical protein
VFYARQHGGGHLEVAIEGSSQSVDTSGEGLGPRAPRDPSVAPRRGGRERGRCRRHLCTLDAYFESVPKSELWRARGVQKPTMAQILTEIRALFAVDDLDVLKHRWEREWGRGATLVREGWLQPAER